MRLDDLAEMNPALKEPVLTGQVELPKGYLLKIDPKAKENVIMAMQELFDDVRYASHHVVTDGDTLKKIAGRYDLSLNRLAMFNHLLPSEKLNPGTIIQLPERNEDIELTMDVPASDEMVVPDKLQTPVF